MNTQPTDTTPGARALRWRVVDIVVASVLATAAGLVFVVWNIASNPISAPLTAALCRAYRHCSPAAGCSPECSPPW